MKSDKEIALEYLERFKDDIEDCLYCIDEDIEPEIVEGIIDEIECIKITIKLISELEVE